MNVPDGAGDCEGDGDGDGCGFLTAGADPATAAGSPSIVTPRHSTIVAADATVRRFMSRPPPRTHADARRRHQLVVNSAPAGPMYWSSPGTSLDQQDGTRVPADGAEAFGILTSMEERELHFPAEQALIGWRLFRVRRSESGFVLSAPLIHNPGFERFSSRIIHAICYQAEHPAPAPGCRCGLYAA